MIIGQKKQEELLERLNQEGMLSHAYLFSGLEKLGKRTLALKWVASFLGTEVEKLANHQDFILVEPFSSDPEKVTLKKEIKISQIRDLIWQLSLKPSLASRKITIINDAHLMNNHAQTCLLKTLEEPRGETLLILITDKPQKLLPTILSRLQTIKFYPVSNKEIRKYLKEQDFVQDNLEEIIQIIAGRPGLAVDLVTDLEKVKLFQRRMREVEDLSRRDLAFRFQYVKELSQDYQKAKETLELWLIYFRNRLIKAVEEEEETLRFRRIIKFIEKINFLVLTTSVNLKMALETLILEF